MEDHSEGAQAAAAGNEDYYNRTWNWKGGLFLKKNGIVQSYQRDNNDQVVVTKLNRASLEAIAKATKEVM
jgi:Ca-activated chloride channel family protein